MYGGAKKFVLSRPPMNPERASVNKKMIPTPPKEPKKLLCKNKHELSEFETEFTGHVCDSCGLQNIIEGTKLLRCKICDYDVCTKCIDLIKKKEPIPTKEEIKKEKDIGDKFREELEVLIKNKDINGFKRKLREIKTYYLLIDNPNLKNNEYELRFALTLAMPSRTCALLKVDYLLKVALWNSSDIFFILVKEGAPFRDPELLFKAIRYQKLPIIEFLIEKGVNINAGAPVPPVLKEIPIMGAIKYHNNPEILKFILTKKPEIINTLYYNDNSTLLIVASIWKRFDMVKILIDMGANINIINKEGRSALHYAVEKSCIKSIKYLVDAGIDKEVLDKKGETALQIANRIGNIDVINILQPPKQFARNEPSNELLNEPSNNPPDEYMCPITLSLMVDPVIALDGITYERTAIEKWFKSKNKSPKTGVSIENKILIPNFSIKNLIQEWKEKHSVRLHGGTNMHEID